MFHEKIFPPLLKLWLVASACVTGYLAANVTWPEYNYLTKDKERVTRPFVIVNIQYLKEACLDIASLHACVPLYQRILTIAIHPDTL